MSDNTNTQPGGLKSSTLIVCGTILLAVCVLGVLALIYAGKDVSVALSFVGPIVLAVLATVYSAAKLDNVESKVSQIVVQTNGSLDGRIRDAVHAVLDERGVPAAPDVPKPSEGN